MGELTGLTAVPGSRACLGRFVETVKIFNDPVGYVGRNFRMTNNARVDRIVKLGLLPKHGLPMRIHLQDRESSRSVKHVLGNLNEMVSALPQ